MTAAVLLIGAPGTGKSSVLEALSTVLESERVEHGAIESEELSRGWPLLGAELWLAQLAAAIALQRAAGRRLFLVAATTESDAQLHGLRDAVGAERALVVCLSAPADVVKARLQAREPDEWPGKARLIEHARMLAPAVPSQRGIDLRIDTDGRDARDVAREVREALRTIS